MNITSGQTCFLKTGVAKILILKSAHLLSLFLSVKKQSPGLVLNWAFHYQQFHIGKRYQEIGDVTRKDGSNKKKLR